MPRLSPAPCDISIELDGSPLPARNGEVVAASMLAAGETTFSRSIKYHRPRGATCMTGGCSGCLMRVDGVPNQKACEVKARPGMKLERQNSFPSAKLDLFAVNDFLFPRGINHHEMFAGVPIAESVMAKVARQLAGLGKLPDSPVAPRPPARQLRVQVAIVGAGPAGLGCAEVLTAANVPWVLFERDEFIGGSAVTAATELEATRLPLVPKTGISLGATVLAHFADRGTRVLVVDDGAALTLVQPDFIVFAHGGHARLAPFEDNDLPNIFDGRALSRLVRVHQVLPGTRVACVGDPGEAEAVRALCAANGAEALVLAGEILAAHGSSAVTGVTVKTAAGEKKVPCDVLAVCLPPAPAFELPRQAGVPVRYSVEHEAFQCVADQNGVTSEAGVFVAGSLKRPMTAAEALEDGARAGHALVRARGTP